MLPMGDVLLLVRLEDDGAGGVAVPAWAVAALGLDDGAWGCEVVERRGRPAVAFRRAGAPIPGRTGRPGPRPQGPARPPA